MSSSLHAVAARRAVGERIRAARLHTNCTQEALAEAADLDRQAISHIEQGHASPVLDTLICIADALNVPLRDLV
ncbi:helix-turn-helix domain-containing protein [Streptomyces luteocolor]|uniref:helix-turn-helix domain-containing protein n=1 Tax=Streptomyces luteocolor TaxID=285500 RepID=UPI000852D06C|nr:helix-turn-helix transcriptional regulator [Streptomyces luteocolor]